MTMVVGVFESLVNAEDAVADLVASGYSPGDINVLVRNGESVSGRNERREPAPDRRSTRTASARLPGAAKVRVAGATGAEAESALADTLEAAGLKPAAARFFADAICNGAVLVAVHCAEPRAWDARDILDVYNDSFGGLPVAQRRTLM